MYRKVAASAEPEFPRVGGLTCSSDLTKRAVTAFQSAFSRCWPAARESTVVESAVNGRAGGISLSCRAKRGPRRGRGGVSNGIVYGRRNEPILSQSRPAVPETRMLIAEQSVRQRLERSNESDSRLVAGMVSYVAGCVSGQFIQPRTSPLHFDA